MRLLLLLAVLLAGDPWTEKDLMQPQEVAAHLTGPLVIHVGFNVLYRAAHIPGCGKTGTAAAEFVI